MPRNTVSLRAMEAGEVRNGNYWPTPANPGCGDFACYMVKICPGSDIDHNKFARHASAALGCGAFGLVGSVMAIASSHVGSVTTAAAATALLGLGAPIAVIGFSGLVGGLAYNGFLHYREYRQRYQSAPRLTFAEPIRLPDIPEIEEDDAPPVRSRPVIEFDKDPGDCGELNRHAPPDYDIAITMPKTSRGTLL